MCRIGSNGDDDDDDGHYVCDKDKIMIVTMIVMTVVI